MKPKYSAAFSLSCTEPFRFTTLTDGRLEGLELMHTLDAKININHLASYNSVVFTSYSSLI